MNHNLKIQKLLLKKREVFSSSDKINLLKEAINIADTHQDINWGFDLRLDLIGEERNTSKCIESFPAFSWILDTHDNNPELFNEEDFMWEYKWMVGSSFTNANLTLDQINTIQEDFKTRLQRNGFSIRPYYSRYANWAMTINDLETASKYLDLREKEEHDDMSDCKACELDDLIELRLRSGNLDEALTIGKELYSGKLTCAHMPFNTYCLSMHFFEEFGNKEKAKEFFDKAEKELAKSEEAGYTSMILLISMMIRYITKYDTEKAWNYFEKYALWNLNSEDQINLSFSINILPLLKKETTRTLQVSSELPWYRSDNTYNTKELFNYYSALAKTLANTFDKRNGKPYFTEELEKALKENL